VHLYLQLPAFSDHQQTMNTDYHNVIILVQPAAIDGAENSQVIPMLTSQAIWFITIHHSQNAS